MNNKIYLLLFLALIVLPSVSSLAASDIQYTFKQYEPINLRFTCTDEFTGLPCTSGFSCNVSVKLTQNQTLILNNVQATRNAVDYNITVPFNSVVGIYEYNPYCYNSSIGGTSSLYYEITSTGNNSNIIPFILGIAGILFLALGMYFKSSFLGLFSAFFMIVLGVYTMIYGFSIIVDDYSRMFSFITIGLGLGIGLAAVYEEFFSNGGDDS